MKKKIPFSYNAPVTLTFSILCVLVLLTDRFILDGTLIPAIFTAPACMTEKNGFNWNYVLDYVRLFTHVLGHADWTHLLGNLAYILLLGPLMEERYGSKMLALMIVVTSLVTGVLNVCLIPSVLLGASGICFMLIVLSSLNVITRNKIPLTFVFLVAVYIAKEFSGAKTAETSNISVVAHIAGGLCGSLFGFLAVPKAKRASARAPASPVRKTPATSAKSTSPAQNQQNDWRAKWEKIRQERLAKIDSSSPREQRTVMQTPYDAVPSKGPTEDDATVVGTLSL